MAIEKASLCLLDGIHNIPPKKNPEKKKKARKLSISGHYKNWYPALQTGVIVRLPHRLMKWIISQTEQK